MVAACIYIEAMLATGCAAAVLSSLLSTTTGADCFNLPGDSHKAWVVAGSV